MKPIKELAADMKKKYKITWPNKPTMFFLSYAAMDKYFEKHIKKDNERI